MTNSRSEITSALLRGIVSRPGSSMIKATTAALMLMLLLGGCVSTAKSPDLDPVRERAEARWQALLSNDLETAYTFYSPGYRSANSLIDFGLSWRTRRVQFTSADYVGHECEESRCKVTFDAGFKVERPVPGMDVFNGQQTVVENWIEVDGNWWFVPKK